MEDSNNTPADAEILKLNMSTNALLAVAQLLEPNDQRRSNGFGCIEPHALADLLFVLHRDQAAHVQQLLNRLNVGAA